VRCVRSHLGMLAVHGLGACCFENENGRQCRQAAHDNPCVVCLCAYTTLHPNRCAAAWSTLGAPATASQVTSKTSTAAG
jgi:hypothetical protein